MQTEQIVALLIAERDRLSRAIDALQGPAKRPARPPAAANRAVAVTPPAATPHRRKLSAAGRKAIAEAARKRWALIKAGKAPSPSAKAQAKKAG
jgi:hypothetical protein